MTLQTGQAKLMIDEETNKKYWNVYNESDKDSVDLELEENIFLNPNAFKEGTIIQILEKPCTCKEIECHPKCTVCNGKTYHEKDCPNYVATNDSKSINSSKSITIFPRGTIVKYNEIPCELLQDTPYYSETFQPK